jgi:copper chaperone CopZ
MARGRKPAHRAALTTIRRVALHSETFQMSGIRCERCVMRLGAALQGVEGIEAARANLVGEVSLSWDDELVDREMILTALARAGFRPSG